MKRVFTGMLLVVSILALTAGTARAQATGQIFGKVTDATGGVLPGVTVTVSGPTLQAPLVAVSAGSGAYSFPTVPIGTFTVSFELAGFKKFTRTGVIITTGFNAEIPAKLEVGAVTAEVNVTAAPPVVDTKKTTTGQTYTKDILENIPTARDPWQIIAMAPGVQIGGVNVGGSASGQQLGLSVYGTSSNVQWNLEGGSITDLSSNSSPSYFDFDSFEEIQVVTGGGDVSIQSSGLSINLVTKSGSNVFKGTAVYTFENASMQANNVTRALFYSSNTGQLSGNPLHKITNASFEYGGPFMKNRLWWWVALDKQDINTGVVNFFNRDDPACNPPPTTYERLAEVQACLRNDKTIIKNINLKINYQLNASNKFQYLTTSDNKTRNARGASSTTAPEAVTRQTSDGVHYPLATHQILHTLILTDKLVFTNILTHVDGGFFLDYQDWDANNDVASAAGRACGGSLYLGTTTAASYLEGARSNPACMWNIQQMGNNTVSYSQRSLAATYQTQRHSWEAKTDGNYFLSNIMGGDHALKFGVGWRKNPILTFSHYSGGGRVVVQCVGNNAANCPVLGTQTTVAPGSTTGLVPRSVQLGRDGLLNNNWWTYNGYIQDSFSKGKLRVNGGVRYDWQQSFFKGGCIPANIVAPTLIPGQCEEGTGTDPTTGKTIQSFSQFAPRVSATYNLFGNGKTSIHASYSLYYATKITLANSLSGLINFAGASWGNNTTSGACSTTAGTSCWTDANRDGFAQLNELSGTPTYSSANFDPTTGFYKAAGNTVDPSAKIGRTREFIIGVGHELVPNVAVNVDYIYRNYDRGTTSYGVGYEPGSAGFPLSQLYSQRLTYTDPTSGITAPYYALCATCVRPTISSNITMTSLSYSVYKGVTVSITKRFSNRWQMNTGITMQTNPGFNPLGSYTNPTGLEFTNGISSILRYTVKMSGMVQLPMGINASANLNIYDGANRTLSINGPSGVFNGVGQSVLNYGTIAFQNTGTTRFQPTKLLDVEVSKVIAFRGGRNRLTLTFDAFNIFNINTVLGYSSSNLDSTQFNSPNSIVPPRVFRVGAKIAF